MTKKIALILLSGLILFGCSASLDTSNLTAEEKLELAKKLYEEEDYEEAANEFQAIILQYPGSAVIDDAQFFLGMARYKRTEYILAAFEFSKLIKNMSTSSYVAESQYMLAECYYQLSPNYNLDQQYTRKAIEEFQAFIDFFPLNEKVTEAEIKINELNSKLARKEYETAVIYEKMDYSIAALKYYENVFELYHDTQYAPLALYNRIYLLLEKEQTEEALTDINKFLERYPDHRYYFEVESLKKSLDNISASN